MGTTVIFNSFYGATEEYARELASRLGARLLTLDEASTQAELDVLLAETEPLVVLTPVHGPSIQGAEFVAEHGFDQRPVAVAAVGMTLIEDARSKDQMAGPLASRPQVERFYLPGRMNYSELTPAHRRIMTTIITALRLKPHKSANDKAMVAAYDKDVSRLDCAELEPIVLWAQRSA